MKNLKFTVDGENIKPEPTCDFSGLFPGMTEPVRLEFDCSSEWKNRIKVAAFWSLMGKEYTPRALEDGKSCIVPPEALKNAAFRVQILGKLNGEKASTTKCTIYLKGGKT